MVDLSEVVNYLNAFSAVAVMVGVVFIVFQLRQNAKLIKVGNDQVQANLQQNKSTVALSLVERFTDDSFTTRRKTVRDIIKKYSANNWEGFLDTSEDYEVRAFGSYYDFSGYLARIGIIDPLTLEEVLGHRIVFDWEAFEPVVEYYRKSWGMKYIFRNFEWLVDVSRKFLTEKERSLSTL